MLVCTYQLFEALTCATLVIVLDLRRLNLKARFYLLSFSGHTYRRVTFTTSFLRRHTQVHFSVTIDVRPCSLAVLWQLLRKLLKTFFFVFHNHRGHYGFSFRESGSNEKKISCIWKKLIPQTTHLEDHSVFTQSISRVLFSRAQQATSFKSFTAQIELSSIWFASNSAVHIQYNNFLCKFGIRF